MCCHGDDIPLLAVLIRLPGLDCSHTVLQGVVVSQERLVATVTVTNSTKMIFTTFMSSGVFLSHECNNWGKSPPVEVEMSV